MACETISCPILLDRFRRAVKWDLLISISLPQNETLGFKYSFCVRKPHAIAGNILDLLFHLIETSCRQITLYIFFRDATAHCGPGPPHYRGFTITLRQTTFGRTPPDELSARRRYLYLTRHNTHNRQTSILHCPVMRVVANTGLRRHGH